MRTSRLYLHVFAASLFLMSAAQGLHAREITIVGTGDGLDLLKEIGAAYTAANPATLITVPPSIGSGGAIAAVGGERESLGRVARPLTPGEASSGIDYRPIFTVPSAFFVHPGIPVRSLTGVQLRAIFSGEITSWKDVGGPNLRIRVVRREEADSSVAVFRASIPEFRDIKFTERSKFALTTQEAIDSIRDNEGAIGFASYSSVLAKRLGVVALNGVMPTDKTYPANVTLALIFKPGKLDSELSAFLAFFRSEAARRLILDLGARPHVP
ncbi:MAG: hypothetical protein FD175_153 [Beijerinckiaceae bacterium]|nr:MAG: hypothetical protein FD175_153 [Beijerinckiaceae bacterium]